MPITNHERVLLVILGEECGEIVQVASKIQRFGFESYHPNDPNTTNRDLLEQEIADFLAVVGLLTAHGYVRNDKIAAGITPKLEKLKRFGIQ